MYKIICNFCGEENLFSKAAEQPLECANQACQNTLEDLEVIAVSDNEENQSAKKLIGLKLIYQKTSDEIIIKPDSKTILGRKNCGSEILSKISQVSRAHCSIEFTDNQFTVKDLGSTNGTFIGLGDEKTSCESAQTLKDRDFLVLGQEVFLVQLLIEEEITDPEFDAKEEEPAVTKPKEIICTECSFILEKLPCSCPECGTWNE